MDLGRGSVLGLVWLGARVDDPQQVSRKGEQFGRFEGAVRFGCGKSESARRNTFPISPQEYPSATPGP